jgi:glyceraldehyde-3-phosphate dehydrogenase (NAD(P))
MTDKRTIHVVGTGTLGEPLVSLLLNLEKDLGVDEITFHKNTPRVDDRVKIKNLMRKGARLAVEADKMIDFEKIGLQPTYTRQEALEQASVVIDCTSEGLGLKHKADWYQYLHQAQGFIAQGSEFGFGKMYAHGINDATLIPGEDRFIQVVSCNTHNLAVLIDTIALHDEMADNLVEARFVCLRRATDLSQVTGFTAAPDVGKHKDQKFGTHHAKDAWHLFQTRGLDLNLFSSAIKIPTQYMHCLWFNLRVRQPITRDDVLDKLQANPFVALTEKTMSGPIFSFGRDHGYFGRLLNQTVVSAPTVTVRDKYEVTGFCFTPQDGNSLISSIAASSWLLDPDNYEEHIQFMNPYLFEEL